MEEMTMKEQFVKWLPVLALACFAAVVFLIADGHFWNGIVFVGIGASFSSATAIYKKKNDADAEDQGDGSGDHHVHL